MPSPWLTTGLGVSSVAVLHPFSARASRSRVRIHCAPQAHDSRPPSGAHIPNAAAEHSATCTSQHGKAESRWARSAVLRTAVAGFLACPCCTGLAQASKATWGYVDGKGPTFWGGTCASGSSQSPIDLPVQAPAGAGPGPLGPLRLDYARSAEAFVMNTGHGTMQVNVAPGSWLRVGKREWQLLQYHFHSPSEHARGGVRQAMEAHLVHKDADGNLAVLGVLLARGAPVPNQALVRALAFAPLQPGAAAPLPGLMDMAAEAAALLPYPGPNPSPDPGAAFSALGAQPKVHWPYAHYDGSLTTPPCSEGVTWLVLDTNGSVTDSQVLDFESYVAGSMTGSLALNSRPLMPLGDRKLDFNDFA